MHTPTTDLPHLPPLGRIGADDHAAAAGYLQGLAREASETGRDDWAAVADACQTIYTYGADPAPSPADTKVRVNEIQTAILSVTDIQTKEPPAVTLEPVERGEPATCFWAGPQAVGIRVGLEPFQVAAWADVTGAEQPPLPLDEQQADAVRELVLAGLLKEDWLVEVNDELVSDVYQSVFDVLWARSRIDRRIRSNLLTTNVQGWSLWLYEFDDDQHRHVIRPLSIRQAYLDPTVEDVEDAAYAGVDLVIDAAEAKRQYPHVADAIDAEASTGQPRGPDGQTQLGDAYDRQFHRGMVVMRVFWLRNQPRPMTPDEAVEKGLVEQVEVPDGPVGDFGSDVPRGGDDDPLAAGVAPDAGVDGDEAGRGGAAGDGLDAAGARLAGSGDAVRPRGGRPVGDGGGDPLGVPARPLTRLAYRLSLTGEEVAPEDDAWPTAPCLRQVTQLGPYVVDDRECECFDIPLLHNVNVPIPHRPWGLGEPWRLRLLQDAQSDVVDAMVQYAKRFRAPTTTMSQSVYDAMVAAYGDAYLKPGRVMIVPDELWAQTGGRIDNVINPPPMPEGLMRLQPLLESTITKQSGNADVLQGRAQPQIKSGKAIELLQGAAASMVGFKSQRTGDLVYRAGRLMLHSIVTRMTAQDVGRIVSKYKPHVLTAIHARAKAAEWDVAVTVGSGNGAMLQQKKLQAGVDRDRGAISIETYREVNGIDHRQEERRIANEQQKLARAAAGVGVRPAGAGGAPEPQGQPRAAEA
jgi:hypothetical protein